MRAIALSGGAIVETAAVKTERIRKQYKFKTILVYEMGQSAANLSVVSRAGPLLSTFNKLQKNLDPDGRL